VSRLPSDPTTLRKEIGVILDKVTNRDSLLAFIGIRYSLDRNHEVKNVSTTR